MLHNSAQTSEDIQNKDIVLMKSLCTSLYEKSIKLTQTTAQIGQFFDLVNKSKLLVSNLELGETTIPMKLTKEYFKEMKDKLKLLFVSLTHKECRSYDNILTIITYLD